MKLSSVFNQTSKNGRYFYYIITQYDKYIIEPYTYLFINREAKLETLLNEDYGRIKDGVDTEIKKIHNHIDTFDIDNLKTNELEQLAVMIEELAKYLEYIKEKCDPKNPLGTFGN